MNDQDWPERAANIDRTEIGIHSAYEIRPNIPFAPFEGTAETEA